MYGIFKFELCFGFRFHCGNIGRNDFCGAIYIRDDEEKVNILKKKLVENGEYRYEQKTKYIKKSIK